MYFLFLSLVFAICKSDQPQTWGKYGEYPCTHKIVHVGGYVAGGSQDAVLIYPTAAIEAKTELPFVVFAHGMTAGGDLTYSAYVNVIQFVCSRGYIIAAPQSCPHLYCQKWYEDVITTFKTMSSEKGKIDPALDYADFSKTAVYGHSMGGAATVHVSDSKDLNLTCSAAMHPSVADDSDHNESKDVGIPMIWFTGSDDTTVPPKGVYNGYKADTIIPKIYAEISGASHTSAIEMEAPYIGEYFNCMIKGDKDGCAYFFDTNGPNNLCTGTGAMKMTQCIVDTANNTVSRL